MRKLWVALTVLISAVALACTSEATPTPSPTPQLQATPTPTPTPPAEQGSSALPRTLERLPAAFKEEGLWFGDRGRALKLAGFPRPLSFEELLALDAGRQSAYGAALNGIVDDPRSYGGGRSEAQAWKDTFGFSGFEATLTAATGRASTWPFATTYLEGPFDAALVRQKFQALGYQQSQAGGRTYYAIRGDREQDSRAEPGFLRLAWLNRVFAGDGVLLMGPDTAPMEAILKAWAGDTASLAQDPAFNRLARALGNPLSAVLMTRQVALDVESISPRPSLEKQEGWGTLHQWDAMGTGYNRDQQGTQWLTFALSSRDPGAAQSDADELVRRMQGYALPEDSALRTMSSVQWPQQPFQEWCASLTAEARQEAEGSTLAVRCVLKEDTQGRAWALLVGLRALGFLVP